MNALVKNKITDLARICSKHRVSRLELFGSAVVGDFDPERSDFDFLVDFRREKEINAADQYFGLLEDLEALFERHIDLIETGAMHNPYFIRRVNESRTLIYAA